MPIRIKDIATTASASSNNDFFAIDGNAPNNTRKLSAFSPTFGGNVTASGTGSHVFGTTNTVTLSSGAVTATGIISTIAAAQRVVNTTGAFQIYKDATPSIAARFTLNTAAADTAALGVYNGTSWVDPLQVNTTQVLVTTTTASTNTTQGALVIGNGTQGGLGVGGAAYFGGLVSANAGKVVLTNQNSATAGAINLARSSGSAMTNWIDGTGRVSTDALTLWTGGGAYPTGYEANNGLFAWYISYTTTPIKLAQLYGTSLTDATYTIYGTTASTTSNSGALVVGNGTQGGLGVGGAINAGGSVTASDYLLSGSSASLRGAVADRAVRQELVFDGTKGVACSTPILSGDWSVAFVVNRATAAVQQYLIGNDVSGCFYLGFRTSGFLYSGKTFGSPNTDMNLGNVVGVTQHIVITKSGTTQTCYANGVSVGSITDSQTYTSGAATLFAADSAGSSAFNGTGALVGFYNRALSATEVAALYANGTPAAADLGVVGLVPPSNTALTGETFTNFQYDTFTGASTTGFTAVETGGQGCQANTVRNSSGTFLGIAAAGTRYLVTFTATLTSGAAPVVALGKVNIGTASANTVITNGANAHILTSTLGFTAEFGANSGTVFFASIGNTSYAISGFSVRRLGTVLAPDANQPGGGTLWYDTSGNNSTITLPASGVAWNVPTSGKINGPLTIGTATFGGAKLNVYATPADAGYLYGIRLSDESTTTLAFGLQTPSGTSRPFIHGNSGLGFGTAGTIALNITSAQQVQALATTNSTTFDSGALVVSGGVGIGGALFSQQNSNAIVTGTNFANTNAGTAATLRHTLTAGTNTSTIEAYSNGHATLAGRLRFGTNNGQMDFVPSGVLGMSIAASGVTIPNPLTVNGATRIGSSAATAGLFVQSQAAAFATGNQVMIDFDQVNTYGRIQAHDGTNVLPLRLQNFGGALVIGGATTINSTLTASGLVQGAGFYVPGNGSAKPATSDSYFAAIAPAQVPLHISAFTGLTQTADIVRVTNGASYDWFRIKASGQVGCYATDAATTTTSGALVVGDGTNGGLGVSGTIYAGGNLTLAGTGSSIATSSPDSMARIGLGLFTKDQAVTIGLSRRANYGDALIARNLQGQSGTDAYITSETTAAGGYGGFEIQHAGVARILVGSGATTANTVVTPTVAASFTTTTSAFSGTLLANATTNAFRIANSQTPASQTATGTTGQITWDSSYIYVCTATNNWGRSSLSWSGGGGGGGGSSNIWIPASEWIPRTTNGCGINSLESTTNRVNYDVLEFDPAVVEYAQAMVTLPNNWNAGTVTAKFHWTAASGSGDVVWQLSGRAYANDDAIDQATGTAQSSTDTLTAANDLDISPATSAITLAGTAANGNPVVFELSRNATAGGDTLAVDARLIGVEISYTI